MALAGRVIISTRPKHQAGELTSLLRVAGAQVIELPMIEIEFLDRSDELQREISTLSQADWVLVTSSNAVRALSRAGIGGGDWKLGVVGAKTCRAASAAGLQVDYVAEEQTARGLGEETLPRIAAAGGRALIVRGEVASRELFDALAGGVSVREVTVYRSVPVTDSSAVLTALQRVDGIVFTSSEGVLRFLSLARASTCPQLRSVPVAAIGPRTAETLRVNGFRTILTPPTPSVEAVVDVLSGYF